MLAPKLDEGLPYVPASDQVLHATTLVEPNGRVALAFTAPEESGEYPFVCTFPGHWRRMYGVIVVVDDLEAFLANPVEPADPLGSTRALVAEWTTEELLPQIEKIGHGQALERGRALFAEAGCVACHRVGSEGGVVGPELTQVHERLREKGGRSALLRELIEPSALVDAKYQQHFVQTTDGRALTGLVTAEDAESISLVTNPNNPVPEVLLRSVIVLKVAVEGSVMPQGLLDRFHADEILEILAYLESGGDAQHAVYRESRAHAH
jgi:putative heme-binding domain-containing protein